MSLLGRNGGEDKPKLGPLGIHTERLTPPGKKKCAQCGTEFVDASLGRGRRYCREKCAYDYRRARAKSYKAAVEKMKKLAARKK